MRSLRELVTAAVPDPPAHGDLVDRVAGVVRRRRRRRAAAVVGAAAAVAAAAVAAPSALVPDPPPAPTAKHTDPALCPAPYRASLPTGDPAPIFTELPTGAALCTYADGATPVSRLEIGPGAAAVFTTLVQVATPAERVACFLIPRDTHQIVFSFPDRDLVVSLDRQCRFIGYGGRSHTGDADRVLTAFGDAFRAEGG